MSPKTDITIKLIDSIFRKALGAGIVFYTLAFIFDVAKMHGLQKDILLMILTFSFTLISLVAGFYYGSSHKKKEK